MTQSLALRIAGPSADTIDSAEGFSGIVVPGVIGDAAGGGVVGDAAGVGGSHPSEDASATIGIQGARKRRQEARCMADASHGSAPTGRLIGRSDWDHLPEMSPVHGDTEHESDTEHEGDAEYEDGAGDILPR